MTPDEMVRWMMERLMKSTAENFELALARFDAAEREQALAQARRLLGSDDLAERELGERLQSEILHVQALPPERVLELQQGSGGALVPLSLPSSGALPAGATLPAVPDGLPPGRSQEGTASISGSTSTWNNQSQRRPRGRPRKNPQP
jgi:hypothetical protein